MKFYIFPAAVSAFLLMSAAARADGAPPPEPDDGAPYMRACEAYGKGYFYIPGTEICLKIHGYLRADNQAGGQVYNRLYGERNSTNTGSLGRLTLRFSTAQPSRFGTVRSYFQLRRDWHTGAASNWDWDDHDNAGGSTDVMQIRYSYIDIGGVRAGMDRTIFDSWVNGFGNVLNDDANNPMEETTRLAIVAYRRAWSDSFSTVFAAGQPNGKDAIDNYGDSGNLMTGGAGGGKFIGQRYMQDMPGYIVPGDRTSNYWGFRFTGNGVKYHEISQEGKNYNIYYAGGLKYTRPWGTFYSVAGYDAYWGSLGAKARIDLNLTKNWTVWVMGAYKSVKDYYYVDGTFSKGGAGRTGYRIRNGKPVVGLQRATQSIYGDWGGHLSFWWGGTYQFNPNLTFNFQSDYSADKTYYTTVNIAKVLAPGLTLTPEVSIFYWNNNYGCRQCMTIPGFAQKADAQLALKGKVSAQFTVRLERDFY